MFLVVVHDATQNTGQPSESHIRVEEVIGLAVARLRTPLEMASNDDFTGSEGEPEGLQGLGLLCRWPLGQIVAHEELLMNPLPLAIALILLVIVVIVVVVVGRRLERVWLQKVLDQGRRAAHRVERHKKNGP